MEDLALQVLASTVRSRLRDDGYDVPQGAKVDSDLIRSVGAEDDRQALLHVMKLVSIVERNNGNRAIEIFKKL